jgi:hypothetical protein
MKVHARFLFQRRRNAPRRGGPRRSSILSAAGGADRKAAPASGVSAERGSEAPLADVQSGSFWSSGVSSGSGFASTSEGLSFAAAFSPPPTLVAFFGLSG